MTKWIKLWNNFLNHFLICMYEIGLETSMKDSDFAFDCVSFLHFKCHKIHFKHCESYIDSPHWIKNKKKQQYQSYPNNLITMANAFHTLQQSH